VKLLRPRRRLLRRADLLQVPVLDIREIRETTILTVAVTASHAILVRVGSEDAIRDLDRETADSLDLPLLDYEGRAALVLTVENPPAGLAVGDVIDLQIRFVAEVRDDLPMVEAVACHIAPSPVPRRKVGITLPQIGMPVL
jgi:hypothetical protein